MAVHPSDETDALKAVAETLELEVLSDPLVPLGTYWLGLAAVNPDPAKVTTKD
jgi:hypothetical protein